ncbi:MAG TPA: PIN domain-containing protein [Stellaceae bacterium]|nr:PIN domain-containing protein [Stellaceae bacterium]
MPVFFDTNVLIYSISRNPAEATKRRRAITLLERDDGALSVQVLQEFYAQATRATRPHRLPHDVAVDLLTGWTRFRVQDITLAIVNAALEIRAAHRFSYWDSAIIAAARALGCAELYTEDMSHGRQVEGVLIINPFR